MESAAYRVLAINPGSTSTKVGLFEGETEVFTSSVAHDAAKLDEFDATKQDDLKKKIKDELNDKLGQGSVYDVYFTSFLLQ